MPQVRPPSVVTPTIRPPKVATPKPDSCMSMSLTSPLTPWEMVRHDCPPSSVATTTPEELTDQPWSSSRNEISAQTLAMNGMPSPS
ncbi:MAG: hypothetical protein R3B68_09030 [Phycisphaerales bacterium]